MLNWGWATPACSLTMQLQEFVCLLLSSICRHNSFHDTTLVLVDSFFWKFTTKIPVRIKIWYLVDCRTIHCQTILILYSFHPMQFFYKMIDCLYGLLMDHKKLAILLWKSAQILKFFTLEFLYFNKFWWVFLTIRALPSLGVCLKP